MLASELAFDETADEEAFDEVFAEDAPELAAEAEVSADLDSTAPAEFLLLSEEVVSGEELIAALPDIVFEEEPAFEVGDYIFVPGIRSALDGDMKAIPAYWFRNGKAEKLTLYIAEMTAEERRIVKAGCLINYNRERKGL